MISRLIVIAMLSLFAVSTGCGMVRPSPES